MTWFVIFLIIAVIVALINKTFFDISFDFQKDHGVIWYSFKERRNGFILWGSMY